MFKTVKWNTESAALQRFRNTREKIQASRKKQASRKHKQELTSKHK